MTLDPAIKWAGSKRWAIPLLQELYAPHRGCRLVEPFAGSGAVALGLAPERALLADVNLHLINFHVRLRDPRPFDLIMSPEASTYYAYRDWFNALIATEAGSMSARAAELFYYLNRTGFNGLCRFNASGGYNVPHGKYKTVNYRVDFSEYAAAMRDWALMHATFDRVPVADDDFVYLDPPYDDGFTAYSGRAFTWEDQVRLAERFAAHPGPVVASNRATERVLHLYRGLGFDVHTVAAPRSISARGDRESALEMLATKNISLDSKGRFGLIVKSREGANANANEETSADAVETATNGEGEDEMAFLPKGWGNECANAKETINRVRLTEGEYVFLHKGVSYEDTQNGGAIIIAHRVRESKKLPGSDQDPLPPGTDWGYFLPDYGPAKVMKWPNMKRYALDLLGVNPKTVTKEQLAATLDAIGDERQMARGMLIRGTTFWTKKGKDKPDEEKEDFMGVNWAPYAGENIHTAPSVIARRRELDAELSGEAAAAPQQPSSPIIPPSSAGPLPPPPGAPQPPAPTAPDPIAAHLALGWKQHPAAPDYLYMGEGASYKAKSKAEILAGR